MISKTYAIAVAITFLVSVTQASARTPVATGGLGFDVAIVTAPTIDVRGKRAYHPRQWYYYRPTLPYDGYRPYPPPMYQCPYYGSPIPLYPYCWGW
jgi:hypothetical protein